MLGIVKQLIENENDTRTQAGENEEQGNEMVVWQ
jgi:hypothetical protein